MDKKRKVSVILNGQIPINNTLINQINNSDYIIAVDGSANKLFDLQIIPDGLECVKNTKLVLLNFC